MSEELPDEDKTSRSEFSAEVNTDKKLIAVAESEPNPAVLNRNSPINTSSYHAYDVIDRFHVLKQRLNNSKSIHTSDVDEHSSSMLSLNLDEVDKLKTKVKDSSIQGLQSLDTPVPGTDIPRHIDEVEASVMARFHILKARGIDDMDSSEMETKLLPKVVDIGFSGKRKQKPIEDPSEDVISGISSRLVSQHKVGNPPGEKLVDIVKEKLSGQNNTKWGTNTMLENSCMIQSPGSIGLGNQFSAGWYDVCSSDWEHVLKEELSGQNS